MRRLAALALTVGTVGLSAVGALAAPITSPITLQQDLNGYTGVSDTRISSLSTANDRNYGASSSFFADNYSGSYDAILLRFDLSSLNGQVGTITSATLKLREIGGSKSNPPLAVEAHAIVAGNADWSQGAGSNPATDGSATWNHKASYGNTNDVAWIGGAGLGLAGSGTKGYDTTAMGSYSYSSVQGAEATASITLDTDVVQGWIDGTITNAGMILIVPSDTTTQNAAQYGSSEQLTQNKRPALVLEFTPVPEPASGALLLIGGSFLTLRRNRK